MICMKELEEIYRQLNEIYAKERLKVQILLEVPQKDAKVVSLQRADTTDCD